MDPNAYRDLRRSIGSQESVAERLGVHKQTISNRERGTRPVTLEAALALLHLRHVHIAVVEVAKDD